jgi:hypothetical protein
LVTNHSKPSREDRQPIFNFAKQTLRHRQLVATSREAVTATIGEFLPKRR